jgi:ubiquinone/menaquinone biosynthesis C-methylase UbiE
VGSGKPNSQYNVAAPDSVAIRLANSQRRVMYDRFLAECTVAPSDSILDVGVTSDQIYASSNYVEAWYPHKDKIVAAGIDDAQFLEDLYPGMRFVFADGLNLPFGDREFDVVHSSAVLEHVGSLANQERLVRECARVAKRTIFITTPNRWFPVEFHTSLPLVHWLPKPTFRNLLGRTSLRFFADEANLNLMSTTELQRIGLTIPDWNLRVIGIRLFGMTSNLVITGIRYE